MAEPREYWTHYTECRVEPLNETDRLLRLMIPIEVDSKRIDFYVDTGGAFLCLLDEGLVDGLSVNLMDSITEQTELTIRGRKIPGNLGRGDVGLLDYHAGDKYIINLNIFIPDFTRATALKERGFPKAIIGFHGALEYIGFGYLPGTITSEPDRFYFCSLEQ